MYASMAIKNVVDAIVELATNSIDAYNRGIQAGAIDPNKERRMDITLSYANRFSVTDHAIGLYAEEMQGAFLTAGDYTSYRGARGFFSTGAKHISALGRVTFYSFKQGKFSSCYITPEGNCGMININEEATVELRTLHGVPENGIRVSIDLQHSHWLASPMDTINNVRNHYALRDIFADPTNLIIGTVIGRDGYVEDERRYQYVAPKGDEELRLVYTVPGYPQATATWTLYRSALPLPSPSAEYLMQFGFLIESEGALHMVTCMRQAFRNDRNMMYFFGRLRCDYISQLMYDLDANGPSDANPFTVLDPSRTKGINIDHPFIQQLFSIPSARMQILLADMAERNASNYLANEDVNEVIKAIEIVGNRLVEEESSLRRFRLQEYGTMLSAIRDVEANYIQVEVDNTGVLRRFKQYEHIVDSAPTEELFLQSRKSEGLNLTDVQQGELEELEGTRAMLNEDDLVTNSKISEPAFKITFNNTENPAERYSITQSRNQIIMQIYIMHPMIKRYISESPDGLIQLAVGDEDRGVMMVIEMLCEAFSWLMVHAQYELTTNHLAGLTDWETSLNIATAYRQARERIQISLHDAVLNRKDSLFVNGVDA